MENLEIDKLIAEKILGYTKSPSEWYEDHDDQITYYFIGGSPASETVEVLDFFDDEWHQYVFTPSTNISDVWDVVEKLKLTVNPTYDGWEVFHANTSRSERDCKYVGTTNNQEWVKHESAPMAICLAALKSVGIEIK